MELARPAWFGCPEEFAAEPGTGDRAARFVPRVSRLRGIALLLARALGRAVLSARAPGRAALSARAARLAVLLAPAAGLAEWGVGTR